MPVDPAGKLDTAEEADPLDIAAQWSHRQAHRPAGLAGPPC